MVLSIDERGGYGKIGRRYGLPFTSLQIFEQKFLFIEKSPPFPFLNSGCNTTIG